MNRRLTIALLALLLTATASPGQDETDRLSFYIDTQFQATIGELPRLAWFLPDGAVAAQNTSSDIFLYTRSKKAQPAHLRDTLTQIEAAALRPKQHVACDLAPSGEQSVVSIYTTLARPTGTNPQVLATSKALPDLEAGFEQAPLRGRAESEVWREMHPMDADQPRLSSVIRRKGTEFFYSLAALYSGPQKEVTRTGLFLHEPNGKILAAHVEEIRGNWCDGCAMPTFADGIERIYAVENMFTAPVFAYPVLMLDTSTVEGRSIELVTFTPSREYSRHMFYEYVAGCFN